MLAALVLSSLAYPQSVFALLALQQERAIPAAAAPAKASDWAPRLAEALRVREAVVPFLLEAGPAMQRMDAKERQLFGDSLEPLLQRVYFTPERFPGDERLGVATHVVQKGDTGGRIGQKHRFGHALLGKWNAKYDERRLAIGQKLKVLHFERDELELAVERGVYRLSAWHGAAGARTPLLYTAVGVGANDSPTPAGTTRVVERVKNPSWTHPETKITYAHGDPRNILGGYWIELDAKPLGRGGIGLHGYTGAPTKDWLEQKGSHGCVRLRQNDCERVFDLALEGTVVVLR